MFLNGLMVVETTHRIIEKVIDTKKVVEGAKQYFEDLLGRAQQIIPSMKEIT